MTQFYSVPRPVSGVIIKPEECEAPSYDPDIDALADLAWQTKVVQKQFAKVIDSLRQGSEGQKTEELAGKGAVLEEASREMTMRLQIASKLVLECRTLDSKIEQCEEYEEKRALRKRLCWIVARVENAVDAGLAACEKATLLLNTMKPAAVAEKKALPPIASPSQAGRDSGGYSPVHSHPASRSRSPLASSAVNKLHHPPSAKSAKSVTFKASNLGDGNESSRVGFDVVDEYWIRAHNRYSFHRNTEAMIRQDPNTLHNLGIAVCDSYVEPIDAEKQGLPPGPVEFLRLPDFYDFERRALDTLDSRVFKMYEKIADAANLACSTEEAVKTPSQTSLISIDHELLGNYSRSVTTAGAESLGKASEGSSLYRQSTPFSVRIERLHEKLLRLGKPTSDATPMVDPKDLPSLPLPRMKRDQVYPPKATDWLTDKNVGKKHPQLKVVNQHKLYEETQLKLFRAKTRSQVERSSKIMRKPTFDGEAMDAWSVIPKMASLRKIHMEEQRDRLKDVLNWLKSDSVDQQLYAVKTLQGLRVGSETVIENLSKCQESENLKVSATLALLTLGVCNDAVIDVSDEILSSAEVDDSTKTSWISELVKNSIPNITSLTDSLRRLCVNLQSIVKSVDEIRGDPETCLHFMAAILLGIVGCKDQSFNSVAKSTLQNTIRTTDNTWIKAQALEVVVRFLGSNDLEDLHSCYEQIESSSSWECRGHSLCLIMCWDPEMFLSELSSKQVENEESEKLYQIVRRSLWNETSHKVRALAADVTTVLNLRTRAVQESIRDLESSEDALRLQAVISIGTLGVRRNSTVKLLIEMLEIDQSDYVKVHIMRTLQVLMASNARVLRLLAGKVSQGGPIGREASKCLAALKPSSS